MVKVKHRWILPIIVIAQFCCTSLWFAGNAIIADLIVDFNLNAAALGHLTSAVQFGFILGTLLFAVFNIADRFSSSNVFFISAILASLFNLFISITHQTLLSLLLFRFLTGFFLAGIYPVGMKIAADYFKKGLGQSLGFLVGALVLGTALPHVLNTVGHTFSWRFIVYITSTLSVFGGVIIVTFIPEGPYKKRLTVFNVAQSLLIFRGKQFNAAAIGYFGHMWELYAFWTFVPILLIAYKDTHQFMNFNVPLLSFLIIAIGGIGCVLSGYLSTKFSTKKIAAISLFISGCCCLLLPVCFYWKSQWGFIGFLLIWGIAVIADSPLFSTLVAQNVKPELRGTGLTLVNCIGFAVTIISIQLLTYIIQYLEVQYLLPILAIGPIIGVLVLKNKRI